MAGKDNLIVPSSGQARENGRKGGKARAANAKKRKALRDCMEILLSLPPDADESEALSQAGLSPRNMNKAMFMALSMYQKALKGDVSAFREIRDLIGEKEAGEINRDIVILLEGETKDFAK